MPVLPRRLCVFPVVLANSVLIPDSNNDIDGLAHSVNVAEHFLNNLADSDPLVNTNAVAYAFANADFNKYPISDGDDTSILVPFIRYRLLDARADSRRANSCERRRLALPSVRFSDDFYVRRIVAMAALPLFIFAPGAPILD